LEIEGGTREGKEGNLKQMRRQESFVLRGRCQLVHRVYVLDVLLFTRASTRTHTQTRTCARARVHAHTQTNTHNRMQTLVETGIDTDTRTCA